MSKIEQILAVTRCDAEAASGPRVRNGGTLMHEINIKLWRHTEEQDWSAEVHGRRHEHISTKTVDELVEYVLVATQQALLEPAG